MSLIRAEECHSVRAKKKRKKKEGRDGTDVFLRELSEHGAVCYACASRVGTGAPGLALVAQRPRPRPRQLGSERLGARPFDWTAEAHVRQHGSVHVHGRPGNNGVLAVCGRSCAYHCASYARNSYRKRRTAFYFNSALCGLCGVLSDASRAISSRQITTESARFTSGTVPWSFCFESIFLNNSASGVMRRRLQAHCLFLIFSVIGWHQWHDALKLFLRQINPTEVEDTCAKGRLAVFFSFLWEDASTSRTGRSSTE